MVGWRTGRQRRIVDESRPHRFRATDGSPAVLRVSEVRKLLSRRRTVERVLNRLRRRCCGALQKSICQKTESKQVLQRADEMVIAYLRRRGRGKICPVSRNQ